MMVSLYKHIGKFPSQLSFQNKLCRWLVDHLSPSSDPPSNMTGLDNRLFYMFTFGKTLTRKTDEIANIKEYKKELVEADAEAWRESQSDRPMEMAPTD